jgi:dihydrofolate reductase
MRKLIVLTFVTLDGVMQAPGGPEEDPSGGFKYGGWSMPLFDDTVGQAMGEQMGHPFDLLLGRKTYDIFASFWPKATDPTGDAINRATKYVVTHRPVSTDWKKTVPIDGDVVGKIKKLKQEDGPELQVHGSSNLIQTLLKNDLVDELWLKIYPITLGTGKRLFGEGTKPAAFRVLKSTVAPNGVIVASYGRAGDVKIGTVELTTSGDQVIRREEPVPSLLNPPPFTGEGRVGTSRSRYFTAVTVTNGVSHVNDRSVPFCRKENRSHVTQTQRRSVAQLFSIEFYPNAQGGRRFSSD